MNFAYKIADHSPIIDASHDNCGIDANMKDPLKQIDIIEEVLTKAIPDLHKKGLDAKSIVKGFMVESYIYDGNQKYIDEEHVLKGKSLTDPCIGLEKTEKLILEMHKNI